MRFSKAFKLSLIGVLCFFMSHLPNVAVAEIALNQAEMQAETQGEMVTTGAVVQELSREQAENKILSYISQTEVRQKLIENGVAPDEAKERLAALSNQEIQKLSSQVDRAQYGGDILFAILIVVLIIYLIKRI